ncbi:MAG: hypothetical protein R3D89_12810 [Sphingomonadaceae bacterium]
MTDTVSIVAIVSVLGWLVLALAGLRSHNLSMKRTVKLAGTWVAIFVGLVLVLKALGV